MWESFSSRFMAARLKGRHWRPFQTVNEGIRRGSPILFVHVPATARQRRMGTTRARKFQDLRVTNMTKNERAPAAIPHQDMRNLRSPAWLSVPRGAQNNRGRRELLQTRRNRHGFARAIENLRGVRLSLVPRPDSRECLLPGV